MARRRGTRLLLQALVWWALVELCCGGPRPHHRGGPARHPRHPHRWIHRTQDPAQHDQRIEYPSLEDEGGRWLSHRGQEVVYPSLVNDNDNDGSGQAQVNSRQQLLVVVQPQRWNVCERRCRREWFSSRSGSSQQVLTR